MKLSSNTVTLTKEQQNTLTGVLPYLSDKGLTGIIRFVRNLYKKQGEGAKTVELAKQIVEQVDTNKCDSVQEADGFNTWVKRIEGFDASLIYTEKGELIELTPELVKLKSEETLYLTTEQLSGLAVKCFGPDILKAVDWNADTPTKLVQLANFLGLSSDKAQMLDSVIGIFLGD